MNDNLPSRPKLSSSLASSLRQRSMSTPATPSRSLPSLPVSNPVKAPVSQTPGVTTTTAAAPARSLPAVSARNALPVIAEKQPAIAPVKEPKVNAKRSAAAKKRNRGPVITPRDRALLKFLCKVNIATAALIAEALWAFKYEDVRTGELKPASVHGIKARLTVLRKEGLVDYKSNGKGVTVWFPLWDGYEIAGKPFPDNRPRHARTTEAPKPQKARVAPKESKWAHTLGLAALTIQYKRLGYQIITDDQMLSASEEMRALNKASKGYISDTDIKRDLSFKDIDQFRESADHFTFPNWEGGSHRPDLVVMHPEYGVTAIELELHRKNIRILKSIFMGFALSLQSGRFDNALYIANRPTEPYLCRYLKECIENSHPALRPFYERITIQSYDAAEWGAEVPEL